MFMSEWWAQHHPQACMGPNKGFGLRTHCAFTGQVALVLG